MKKSRVAFDLIDKEDHDPVGYKEVTCHQIFDIKMNLTRKYRYVAIGHLTNPPLYTTYAIMVGSYTLCLAFRIATLNDLNILSEDIQNAYFKAPTKERVLFYSDD